MILQRIKPLAKQLNNKEFRDGYLDSHVKMFIAEQIKCLRGHKSQKEFAKELGTTQSVVSRLENPEYGKVTIQTLLEIASKLDIALLVRFSGYPEFLEITSDFSEKTFKPKSFDQKDIELMTRRLEAEDTSSSSRIILVVGNMGETQTSYSMPYGHRKRHIAQYAK
jgi:transcriptional regulator with XRE-family HTH domain